MKKSARPAKAPGSFAARVLAAVKRIPRGKTKSYAEIALAAGSPGAFRAVGNILNKNYDPAVPCHRVIRRNGETGGYNRGRRQKIELLRKENAGP
jgi:O-6-methylguanine DNA methyltransferase